MKVTIKITKETTRQELLDLKKCIDVLLETHTSIEPEKKQKACIKKDQIVDVSPAIDPILARGYLPVALAHKILNVPKSVTWLYWKINKGDFSFRMVKEGSKKIMHVSAQDITKFFSKNDHK